MNNCLAGDIVVFAKDVGANITIGSVGVVTAAAFERRNKDLSSMTILICLNINNRNSINNNEHVKIAYLINKVIKEKVFNILENSERDNPFAIPFIVSEKLGADIGLTNLSLQSQSLSGDDVNKVSRLDKVVYSMFLPLPVHMKICDKNGKWHEVLGIEKNLDVALREESIKDILIVPQDVLLEDFKDDILISKIIQVRDLLEHKNNINCTVDNFAYLGMLEQIEQKEVEPEENANASAISDSLKRLLR